MVQDLRIEFLSPKRIITEETSRSPSTTSGPSTRACTDALVRMKNPKILSSSSSPLKVLIFSLTFLPTAIYIQSGVKHVIFLLRKCLGHFDLLVCRYLDSPLDWIPAVCISVVCVFIGVAAVVLWAYRRTLCTALHSASD